MTSAPPLSSSALQKSDIAIIVMIGLVTLAASAVVIARIKKDQRPAEID